MVRYPTIWWWARDGENDDQTSNCGAPYFLGKLTWPTWATVPQVTQWIVNWLVVNSKYVLILSYSNSYRTATCDVWKSRIMAKTSIYWPSQKKKSPRSGEYLSGGKHHHVLRAVATSWHQGKHPSDFLCPSWGLVGAWCSKVSLYQGRVPVCHSSLECLCVAETIDWQSMHP